MTKSTFELNKLFLAAESAAGLLNARDYSRADITKGANLLVKIMIEADPIREIFLGEASVHRSHRSKIFTAAFTGPFGGTIWRTTGTPDRLTAMRKARYWEKQARIQRAKLGSDAKKLPLRADLIKGEGLTQEQVARVLRMSIRGVRQVERRALLKLKNHPAIRQLWREYSTGSLDEGSWNLSNEEIKALFDLCINAEELYLVQQIVHVVQAWRPSTHCVF
ncbi:MAG TPA: sigma factor-like helix-turn-helix DNA-binding protein [Verrucomicrobiae bacterium]|nr:sigma factor-like helix-turn-helix DNA-binding protein [Verrucomicrobiae bacterium]